MIFDDKLRSNTGPAKNKESFYSYLDRSARSEAAQIRNVIEEWATIYPTSEYPDFTNKLRSNDDKVFLPAFFELYLYILMKKLNATKIDIEPSVAHTSKHPDFHIHLNDDKNFYLEARCLFEDDEYTKQDDVITRIADRIDNRLKGNQIALGLYWDGDPFEKDFSSKILSDLITWYKNLNINKSIDKEIKLFEFDSWNIKFTVMGKVKSDHRVVNAHMPQDMRMVTVDARLRSALRDKAYRYGKLPSQFAIAANIIEGTNDFQIHNALFGNEATEYNPTTKKYNDIRIGNGFWRGEKKWHYSRVGAVIIANKVNPWSIFKSDNKQLQIYLHPNTENSLTIPSLNKLPIYKTTENNGYCLHEGKSAHEILELPTLFE